MAAGKNMLNYIWLGLVLGSVLLAGASGRLREAGDAAIKSAETAVTLSLGLIGVMSLWLGVMRLAEKSGLVLVFARLLRPALRRLFPDVPPDHPAMGSMVMNIAANMLGLTNAATPLGLRAMRDLETLNPHPGTATNAMCTFLAINTGSVQLLPVTAVALLAAAGAANPTAIIGTALLATCFSSAAGIIAVKTFEKLRVFRSEPAAPFSMPAAAPVEQSAPPAIQLGAIGRLIFALFLIFFAGVWIVSAYPEMIRQPATAEQLGQNGFVRAINSLSWLAIPFLLSAIPLFAALKRIKVYEEFVEGAREGFNVAVKIIPYLVAMLAAIAMFRSAGGIELIAKGLAPILQALHFPADLLPMAIMRPLSGSGSFAILSDIVKQFGPDHLITRMAGTIYGSTETTFYVITVYFGAVGIQRTRHAIPAGLIADLTGIIASVVICRLVFG